ncbi:hypothetical protein, partial [Bradyrhizobium oropedii]|uniref:hypothetical protein n=1 Tax=Bradyrhizobium oropedii TaxID=1571201 RepID=UPI001E4CB1DC
AAGYELGHAEPRTGAELGDLRGRAPLSEPVPVHLIEAAADAAAAFSVSAAVRSFAGKADSRRCFLLRVKPLLDSDLCVAQPEREPWFCGANATPVNQRVARLLERLKSRQMHVFSPSPKRRGVSD